MGLDPSAVWDFAAELVGSVRGGSRRTTATVTRIDADGTVWVTTGDGGEAPASSAAAGVSVGDTVTLEWDGSAMGIRGNVSNPSPAGSVIRRAVERTRSVADAAQRVADAVNQHFFADTSGIHVTEATQEDWDASHTGPNVLINSVGQLFRDGLNNLLTLTTENGARALTVWDGLGNAAENIRAVIGETIQLGSTASGNYVTLDSSGMEIHNAANFGAKIAYDLVSLLSGSFTMQSEVEQSSGHSMESWVRHCSYIRHKFYSRATSPSINLYDQKTTNAETGTVSYSSGIMLNGDVKCAGTISAARTEGTVTVKTGNATIYNNYNFCWNNGACCTVQLCVNLKSNLANGSMVDVATAPAGYCPPHVVFGSVRVTAQYINLQAVILGNGTIRVNNSSGTTVTSSANIYMSFTFAP